LEAGVRPALLVSYTGVLGGAERILLDCAGGLSRPAVVACPDGPLAAAAREQGLEVATVRARSIELRSTPGQSARAASAIAGLAREVAGLVRRRQPAVTVAWSMRALLACAVVPRGPLLFHHNDLLPHGLVGGAVRRAARRAHRVVCLSQAIADDLGLPGAEVIHAGVDLERLHPAGPAPPADAPALTLGAIVGWKRPDLALEVAARVPELRLRLAGEPLDESGRRLLDGLRRRAAQPDLAGRVELVGRVDDPAELLRGSACLLHCAEREPYGLALVEALASGVPVVAPSAGGPGEIVDESCGALYPPRDADSAAQAVRRVLADPTLRGGARARAESEFDRERSRARFSRVLEELAA
jgi:glycosyltransferase involved in cell wall biosynthesis